MIGIPSIMPWSRRTRAGNLRVVSADNHKPADGHADWSGNQGLFRAILAGPGHSLADAFASLERAPHVERILRHPTRDLIGARVAVAPEEGEGYWEFTRIRDEIYVVVANFAYKDPRIELVPGDGLVQFDFKISGDLTLAVSRSEPVRWNRPSLLVWSQPKGVDISEWTAPRAREQFIIVSMRPEFLAQTFLPSGVEVPEPLKAFASSSGEKINYCQHPLSSQTFEVATRLINNRHFGPLALVYTEALALELVCHAVASLSALTGAPAEQYSDRELRCLHAARALLMRQFAPAPTIEKLARSVGMSKSILTKGFKAVFGETIFDFSLRCRMGHALSLIREQGWSVEQAGQAIGYAHPTSFTTAFRRHFGMRPIDVRSRKSHLRSNS
jgi:AraC-like DNA-binding protein